MIALLAPFWKAIALAALILGATAFWHIEEGRVHSLEAKVQDEEAQLKTDEAQLKLDAADIAAQNASIQKLKVAGDEQQATIEGLAKEAQINAGKAVTQWKTKYVPTPIPVECYAAVAAGAANAASVAHLFTQ